MKTASKVLLTIGGIFHIVNAVSYFFLSIFMMVYAIICAATGSFMFFKYSGDSEATMTVGLMILFIVLFFLLSFLAIACGVASIIASKMTFKAKNSGEKGKLIAAIIFGGILEVYVAILGGIFGLVALKKEGASEEAPKEIETAEEVVK